MHHSRSRDAVAPRITVIGTGYLGATHAACMAELGYEVLGMDVDPHAVAQLSEGRAPFFEPGLNELLATHVASGCLRFTSSFDDVADFGDIHFVCVGTPQRVGHLEADLSYLHAVIDELGPRLRRPSLIVGKSTVPVGTAADLDVRLRRLAPDGVEAEVAWNPEFLREAHAIDDTLRPDRLVFGVASEWAEGRLRDVYADVLDLGTPLVVTDLATAELVKVAANSFLATKISFVNALAEVCEAVGADVVPLTEALSYDERIGRRFLRSGLGFGGGCLPKDIRAFAAHARNLGVGHAVDFLDNVDAINTRRRARVVHLATEAVGGDLNGRRVAVLGAAFKPDTDDVRDSPALDVACMVQAEGAEVTVFDPRAVDSARRACPDMTYAASTEEACRGADVVLLLTEWQEFCELDPATLGQLVAHRCVVDARNALDRDQWVAAGWFYCALGRPDQGATLAEDGEIDLSGGELTTLTP